MTVVRNCLFESRLGSQNPKLQIGFEPSRSEDPGVQFSLALALAIVCGETPVLSGQTRLEHVSLRTAEERALFAIRVAGRVRMRASPSAPPRFRSGPKLRSPKSHEPLWSRRRFAPSRRDYALAHLLHHDLGSCPVSMSWEF